MFVYVLNDSKRTILLYFWNTTQGLFLSKDDDIEIAALGKMVHTNGLTDLYL